LPVMDRVVSKKRNRNTLYVLGCLLLLTFWSAASLLTGSYIIPSPWHTAIEMVSLLAQGFTWKQILITVFRVAAGFSLALACGSAVGILSGLNQNVETLFRPLVLLVQGIPPLLWIIPLILVLGIGRLAPVLVIALICFPIVALNVNEGMKAVPNQLEQMLDVFAPGAFPKIRELILPHLKPFLAAAAKLGIVLGIKASVIAEYFGANNGIGFQVQAAFQSLQVRKLFAWGLIIIFLILVASWILGEIERALARPWKRGEGMDTIGSAPAIVERLKQTFVQKSSQREVVLQDVSFAYPEAELLLDRISLTVRPNEIVVISGDSGVGKTTLLCTVAGLLTPISGTVKRPERLSFVFQDERFLPWRSNRWNVALPLYYSGIPLADSLAYTSYLFGEAGLSGWESRTPDELSGGMKKRLGFARCFARFPDAMLLDEPFSGIDAEGRRCLWRKFMALIDMYHGPVLIVTHFHEEIPPNDRCTFFNLAPSETGGKSAKLFTDSILSC